MNSVKHKENHKMLFGLSNHKGKNKLRLVGIGLFIFIIYKVDLLKLLDCLKSVKIFYIVIVLVLNFFLIFTKALRWNSILKAQQINLSLIDSFLIYYSGSFLGVISPSRIGEFVKAFYLKMEGGISFITGILSVLVDRLFDIYILIILGIIGIWQFNIFGKLSNVSFILIIPIMLAPVLMCSKQLMRRCMGILYNSFIINKSKDETEKTFKNFCDQTNRLISCKLVFPAILTCLGFLILITQYYLLIIAMNTPINIITITLFMGISRLISIIPISISGLGTRDAILIYLFSLIGLKSEPAVSYSFLIFITLFVSNGLIGAVAWWIKPIRIFPAPIKE